MAVNMLTIAALALTMVQPAPLPEPAPDLTTSEQTTMREVCQSLSLQLRGAVEVKESGLGYEEAIERVESARMRPNRQEFGIFVLDFAYLNNIMLGFNTYEATFMIHCLNSVSINSRREVTLPSIETLVSDYCARVERAAVVLWELKQQGQRYSANLVELDTLQGPEWQRAIARGVIDHIYDNDGLSVVDAAQWSQEFCQTESRRM